MNRKIGLQMRKKIWYSVQTSTNTVCGIDATVFTILLMTPSNSVDMEFRNSLIYLRG